MSQFNHLCFAATAENKTFPFFKLQWLVSEGYALKPHENDG